MEAAELELCPFGGGVGAAVGGARPRPSSSWYMPAGWLWRQVTSRGEVTELDREPCSPAGAAATAPYDSLSGYLSESLSDLGLNSECSPCLPVPDSEENSAGLPRTLHNSEWSEERFRVDRRKLMAMFRATVEGKGNSGKNFFQKIMEETSTRISWPAKVALGAKLKKDPNIKVSGRMENVKAAKENIMSVLRKQNSYVTLKMDVSYTEHSRLIGKGGNNVKKMMAETGCHIHFHDSRWDNRAEKINQVSIVGQPDEVESARVRIRELLPLVLRFELPMDGNLQPIPDFNSPAIQHFCETYNISVSFTQRSQMHGATVIVRGSQKNSSAVKETTSMLLEHLAGSLASTIPVSTQLNIAARHHLFMMGHNGSNVKYIMYLTGAQIQFPDPCNPQRKSTVYMQGTVESVCLAREYIMGCIPLVLTFDVKEEIQVQRQFLTQIMDQFDVFISFRPKPKQPGKFVKMKSIEQNALNLYKARSYLLGLESSKVTMVSTPSTPSAGLGLVWFDCDDAFVEVGMPRSQSYSPNNSDLKQMMSSSKQACAERQTVEVLQGTENFHLHTEERLLSNAELSSSESPVADKKAPGCEWAAARAATSQQNSVRASPAPRPSFVNMQDSLTPLSWNNIWEHLESGSESDTWRDWNGCGPTAHDFVSSMGSPKWQQNKSAEHYLSSNNDMDCVSSLTESNGCNPGSLFEASDLPELFSQLGLSKYTNMLQQQEIDLHIFLTLTDQDLKELGVAAFGARRKMLLAISELNRKRRKPLDPSNNHTWFLEGGASGTLPCEYQSDIASVSRF